MASVSLLPIYQPKLADIAGQTFAAIFFCMIMAAIIFGSSLIQTYIYYHRFTFRDPLHQRITVCALIILGGLQSALISAAVYHYLVKNFGNLAGMTTIVWSVKLQVLIGVVVVWVVQCLYGYRVWRLSGFYNGIMGYIVIAVITAGFAIGIVFTYSVYTHDTFQDLAKNEWIVTSALASATVIDFILAGGMCYYLFKSRGMGKRLNSKIAAIIQYTIGSGALTSAVSLATIITYLLDAHSFVYLGLQFLLFQLYIASYLAMMNARTHGDNHATVVIQDTIPFHTTGPGVQFAERSTPFVTFAFESVPGSSSEPSSRPTTPPLPDLDYKLGVV